MPDSYLIRPAAVHGRSRPLESRLRGTGRVADDLFLMAHDDRSGRPLLASRPLGLGLAAGLLAELMLGNRPALRTGPDGALRIAGEVRQTAIAAHPLLRLVAAEPQLHPVPDWLAFLAISAARDVGARLEQAGYLTRVQRRLPGRPARLVPADSSWAFAPVSRVIAALDPRRRREPYTAALAGLADASGLGFRLDQYTAAARSIETAVSHLTPDLQALIGHTRNTVATAVQSRP